MLPWFKKKKKQKPKQQQNQKKTPNPPPKKTTQKPTELKNPKQTKKKKHLPPAPNPQNTQPKKPQQQPSPIKPSNNNPPLLALAVLFVSFVPLCNQTLQEKSTCVWKGIFIPFSLWYSLRAHVDSQKPPLLLSNQMKAKVDIKGKLNVTTHDVKPLLF